MAPAPVEILVRLSGVQYTNQTAVDSVTQVFDRAGINYKSVELAGGKSAPKKTTAKKATAAKSATRKKKTTARKTTRKSSRRRG